MLGFRFEDVGPGWPSCSSELDLGGVLVLALDAVFAALSGSASCFAACAAFRAAIALSMVLTCPSKDALCSICFIN